MGSEWRDYGAIYAIRGGMYTPHVYYNSADYPALSKQGYLQKLEKDVRHCIKKWNHKFMSIYLQCWISAENKEQADHILNSLLEKKLVAGGLLLNAPARFWWKGKIISMNYHNISSIYNETTQAGNH